MVIDSATMVAKELTMTEDQQSKEKKAFQVVDKRRFDSDGAERSPEEQALKTELPISEELSSSEEPLSSENTSGDPSTKVSGHDPKTEASTAQESIGNDGAGQGEEPVAFTSFVMSLATQVLVQLGEMPAPSGMEIPQDLESARQTIDILTMLQSRTRGNLTTEEVRFLEEVLHSLRMSFINAKKKAS